MNILKFLIIPVVVVLFSHHCEALSPLKKYPCVSKNDTISVVLLYELNVPQMCYQRFDQIEQDRRFILYDAEFSKLPVDSFYYKGTFCLSYGTPVLNFEREKKVSLYQNKKAIYSFRDSVKHIEYQWNRRDKSLVCDRSGRLFYKKIFAKLVVVDIDKQVQLIPKMFDYHCCYANEQVPIKTYFIVDILDFKLL